MKRNLFLRILDDSPQRGLSESLKSEDRGYFFMLGHWCTEKNLNRVHTWFQHARWRLNSLVSGCFKTIYDCTKNLPSTLGLHILISARATLKVTKRDATSPGNRATDLKGELAASHSINLRTPYVRRLCLMECKDPLSLRGHQEDFSPSKWLTRIIRALCLRPSSCADKDTERIKRNFFAWILRNTLNRLHFFTVNKDKFKTFHTLFDNLLWSLVEWERPGWWSGSRGSPATSKV